MTAVNGRDREKTMRFSAEDFAKATGATVLQEGDDREGSGVSTDSRSLQKGDLFFALKGPHFDGHHYIEKVLSIGAWGGVVEKRSLNGSKNPIKSDGWIFRVSDSVRALGDFAHWWRSRFDIPAVAITGSNGKTTTKEMLAAILATRFETLKTEGNYNNLIGLPLTLIRLRKEHRAMVLEMGMNATGEIRRLAEIAQPTVGIITNAAAAHLEKLGSVEAVARAKCELFDAMSSVGTAVYHGEDPNLPGLASRFSGKKISFGIAGDFDVVFEHVESKGFDEMLLSFRLMGEPVLAKIGTTGLHNVLNAMAAATAAKVLGCSAQEIARGLESFTPIKMRFEQIQLANGVRLVNDAYNANPVSMLAAFRTVGKTKRAGRFLAVLGDMKELGSASKNLHEELGEQGAENGVDRFFLIGEYAENIAAGAGRKGVAQQAITVAVSHAELAREVAREMRTGDIVLVKASRGMALEKVVEELVAQFGI